MCSSGLWVDEARGLVYFVGLKDTPLEQHLYVTSLTQPGFIQRLTQPGYSHQVALNHVSEEITCNYNSLQKQNVNDLFILYNYVRSNL